MTTSIEEALAFKPDSCEEVAGSYKLLDDANFEEAVAHGIISMMTNSGQSCNAPSRMLVPESRLEEVEAIARAACEHVVVGDSRDASTTIKTRRKPFR